MVSRIGLGTMDCGYTVDESSSFAVMDAAIDAGINFFDAALALCAASARHFMGLTSEQSLYNLAVRTVELELIPALRSLGIGPNPGQPAPCRPARRRARNRHRGRHLRRLDAAAHRGAPQPARSL
jgi:aryl-alcohol dehydrogenase-like predicted oxidoreductase